MMLAIRNGHVIDPGSRVAKKLDVLVEGTHIQKLGPGLEADEIIDASGCVVCPGFVDLHVHFREPGFESKETIRTGSNAAARGGFTSVVTMANTNPPIDDAGMVEFINRRARETACIKVHPAACATKERAGREMTEMGELRDVGAVAVSDDGTDIADSWVLRRVLEYAEMCNLPYLAHCQDESLAEDGVMNEGYNSTRMGLPGMPREMEETRIDRNIRLAALANARIHIQHVTTEESVEIIRRAKAKGIRVTCETAPHYLALTDEAVTDFGTNAKMNPPLREPRDVKALKKALADGTIDCIATDHAPHTLTEKDVEFQLAPFGVIGLETALGIVITELVDPGVISLERAIELITAAPAQILDLPAGKLRPGGPADITVLDPKAEWIVDPSSFASMSGNTPFAGRTLHGQVKATVCDGTVVYMA